MKKYLPTKSEWILLSITAVFLCVLLTLYHRDQNASETGPVIRTELPVSSEDLPMPEPLPEPEPPKLVDINSADVQELIELPGIGEKLAERILEYRAANGPFSSIDELLNVSGIGQQKLDAIRDLIIVQTQDQDADQAN